MVGTELTRSEDPLALGQFQYLRDYLYDGSLSPMEYKNGGVVALPRGLYFLIRSCNAGRYLYCWLLQFEEDHYYYCLTSSESFLAQFHRDTVAL